MSLPFIFAIVVMQSLNAFKVFGEVTDELAALKQQVQRLEQQSPPCGSAASVYTRWGNANCTRGAETVYSGSIGGSYFEHQGAAANFLCLPPHPEYDNHPKPRFGFAHLYGAEYEVYPENKNDLAPTCAVCRITRSTHVMIPASRHCSQGWTLEYLGYLMAGYYNHPGASEYICVDSNFGYLPGSQDDTNAATLYYTLSMCLSLPCPPYINDKIVSCVVCSK